MPTIYRAMKKSNNGVPLVAPSATGLGVREPPGPHADVDVDEKEKVILNGKGMSVADHWRNLPVHRIPKRLDDGITGADGPNTNYCWRMGQGSFATGSVSQNLDLILKRGSTSRGNVASTRVVLLAEFQSNLGATRQEWVIDES